MEPIALHGRNVEGGRPDRRDSMRKIFHMDGQDLQDDGNAPPKKVAEMFKVTTDPFRPEP